MGVRHEGREAALRMLYQADLSGDDIEAVLRVYLGGALARDIPEEPGRRFAEHLLRGVLRRREELDELIRSGSAHWRLERMAAVDRNVIRLALFELLDDPTTPAAVILDEAVELAKLYGGDESGAFVNGVLDGIRQRLDQGDLKRG